MELKQQKERQHRENELQKAAQGLRDRQYEQSLTDINACFEKVKQIFGKDLVEMEKLGKRMRKARRKVKAKQITELNQKEIEFDDLLSCSGSSLEEVKADKTKTEDEDSLPFEVGLGGVIIRKNGEPLEPSVSAEWDNKYDDSNSCVRFGKLKIGKSRILRVRAQSSSIYKRS